MNIILYLIQGDKIPNKYFIDLKVHIAGEVSTYKKQLTFFIVNKK